MEVLICPLSRATCPFPPSLWEPRLSCYRTLPQPKLQTCNAQGLMRAIPELFSACDLRPETLECVRADTSGVHYAALVKAVFCALGTNSQVDPDAVQSANTNGHSHCICQSPALLWLSSIHSSHHWQGLDMSANLKALPCFIPSFYWCQLTVTRRAFTGLG